MLIATIFFLNGCQSISTSPPKEKLTFIDSQNFDNEFTASLTNMKVPVTVDFYNPITPNDIPPRLEKWMALAENNGGKIFVTQPPNEMAPKDPLFLIGLFNGLWQLVNKLKGGHSSYSMDEAIKNRNVNINLARNKEGKLYIEKIVFVPKDIKQCLRENLCFYIYF